MFKCCWVTAGVSNREILTKINVVRRAAIGTAFFYCKNYFHDGKERMKK